MILSMSEALRTRRDMVKPKVEYEGLKVYFSRRVTPSNKQSWHRRTQNGHRVQFSSGTRNQQCR